jgi:hypothetical protein
MPLDIKPDTSNDEAIAPTIAEPEPLNLAPVFPALTPDEEENEPTSPLGNIKAKRAGFMDKMYKDIHVPRWLPENGLPYLFVRIRPIQQTELFAAIRKRKDEYDQQVLNKETPPEDSGMKANADLVAMATKGIYFLADEKDTTKYAVTGSTDSAKWTKFDGSTGPITAELLGITVDFRDPVASLVRGVFNDIDGDLLWFTNRLLEFSNLSNSEADTAF